MNNGPDLNPSNDMHTHRNKKKEEKQYNKAKAEKKGFILPLSVSISP